MDTEFPKVSIVVCAYNEAEKLPDCIESLLSLDYPKDKLEIIIVDNKSNDNTKEVIQRYPVIYAYKAQMGVALAKNKGIEESNGKYISFIDADCIVDVLWLKSLIKGFKNELIAGIGGKIVPYKPKTDLEYYIAYRRIFCQRRTLYEDIIPHLIGANCIYRKDTLLKVGMFDVSFHASAGDDVYLGHKICKAGYELKYIPEAIVYHKHRTTILEFYSQFFKYGYGSYILFRKCNVTFNNRNRNLIFRCYAKWEKLCCLMTKSIFSLFTFNNLRTKKYAFYDFIRSIANITGKFFACLNEE